MSKLVLGGLVLGLVCVDVFFFFFFFFGLDHMMTLLISEFLFLSVVIVVALPLVGHAGRYVHYVRQKTRIPTNLLHALCEVRPRLCNGMGA
jgi:hypothetical protein